MNEDEISVSTESTLEMRSMHTQKAKTSIDGERIYVEQRMESKTGKSEP